MSEPEQTPEQSAAPEKRPQDRSPSFPYIGLTKAFERLEGLHTFAKRHDARIVDAAKPAWGLGAKSSGTLQTVAALLSYGLVEASGVGENRKVKISDLGYRAVADPRPGAKEQALALAALKPKLIAEFWEKWGVERPADAIAIGELHIDRGFTSDGAKGFLRVYDDTIGYAAPPESDKKEDSDGTKVDAADPPGGDIAVGDIVCVEVGGQVVVEKAAVRAIQEHDGRKWVFMEGSETGALMSDVALLEKAPAGAAPPPTAPKLPLTAKVDSGFVADSGDEMDRFTVDEGVVKIAFPSGMSVDSLDDLDAFFKLFIKKAKRRAGAGKEPS
ncbi:hypothetical protein [Sphingomonas profundi]|uniref:hypothetical protein n=1 Tax=Alterirhizorhabdus profundi TaxID=2681549 RepID=UPI0012E83408|nr:hypothetical protein [Sphingomonas profundi]